MTETPPNPNKKRPPQLDIVNGICDEFSEAGGCEILNPPPPYEQPC